MTDEHDAQQYGSALDGWLTQHKVADEEALALMPRHLRIIARAMGMKC
jgi:hypothetical protein